MAIYYAPFPSNQPQTSLPQWVSGDWWVNPQTRTDGVAGTSTAYKFNTTPVKRWTATTTGVIPPVSAVPAIFASTVTSSSQITQGQPVNVYAISAYGGAAIATSYTSSGTFVGYNVAITPALPDGLTLTKTFSTTAVTDSAGKQWLYNSVDVYVTGTPTGSVTTQSYTVTFTDATGQTGSASFSLGVGTSGGSQLSTSVAVASKTLSSGTAATPFTPVVASNGTTPYTFAISPSLSGSGLSFSTANGQISGTPTLIIPTANYTVTVTDSSSPTQSSSQQFSLTVTGVGLTTATVIPNSTITQNISFTPFKPVSATGGSGYLTYSVTPALPSGLTYNSANGFITGTATSALDATNFTVTVTDQSNPPQTGTARTFQLTVAALPALVTIVNTSEVVYNINTSQSIAPVSASGGYGTISYAISPALPSGLSFNTTNGVISGTASSAYSRTQFTVTATDSATTPQTSSKSFHLTISGAALTTTLIQPVVTLYNGANTDYTYYGGLTPVTASGGFGVVTFALTAGTLPTGLTLETSNGRIFGTTTQTLANTQFTITATDGTTPVPQTSSKNFYLKSLQPPSISLLRKDPYNVIPGYHFSVNSSYGINLFEVIGGYGSPTFTITGNNFPLGTSPFITNLYGSYYVGFQGTISANGYNLTGNTSTVTITDSAGQTASNTFTYFVDTVPYNFNGYVSHGLIATNNAPISTGTFGVTGGVTPYTWSNTGALPLGLTLEPTTGAIYGTPRQTTNTIITITATDAVGQTLNNYPYYINVGEPAAITTTTVTPNVSVYFNNGAVSERPVTASGGYGTITFSIAPKLPNTLTFLTSNGYIYGIGTQLSANQSYKVTATDSIGQSSNSSFFLETIYTPLSSVKTLPSVSVIQYVPGQSFKPITATGGYGSYIYSATLPTGLSIGSANGVIFGTPTVTQSATSTTINIQDGVGQTTSNTFLLTIAAPAALNVANNTPLTATYGVPFNRVPVQASGGQGANTYALTSGTLTGTGLSFNTSNGAITGTATALKANSTYQVTVTDSVSQTFVGQFQFGILAPALTTTLQVPNKTLTEYQSATPFIPVTALGGYGTYSFSITSGTLPQGLILNQNSGQIFGTPTALINDEIITIEVEDEAGQTSNQSFNLTVIEASVPALQAVLTQSAYVLNQGQFYSFTPVSGSGGVSPFTYSTSSTLPTGLTLNTSSGELYGTPTEVSNANTIVVTVTDSVPQNASKSFEISVVPTPASVDLVGREFANAAFNHANSAYDLANTLYDQANTCCEHGNSAYDHANSSYIHANSSYDQANTADELAQAAYDRANTISAGSTRVTIRGDGTLITDHANSINFIGATVTSTNSGNSVSVLITGGGGGTVDKFELYKFPVGDYGWVTDSIYGGLGDELILNCYDMRVDPECVGLTALDLSS